MGFNQNEAAEFNSGLAIIYQLDAMEKALVESTLTKDFERHYRILLSYFKTLYQFMSQKEKEVHIDMWNKIKKNRTEINAAIKNKRKFPITLLDEFDFWEMELREVKKKHGLGMPAKDPRYTGGR